MTTPAVTHKTEALRLKLFTSYPHSDDPRLLELWRWLRILSRKQYIQPWRDRADITAGELWARCIDEAIRNADFILVVYSVAARDSDYMQDTEIPLALERARRNECVLIVLQLDCGDWDPESPLEQELKQYQIATWNGQPVLDYRPQRKGWHEVYVAIREAVVKQRRAWGANAG